MLTPRSSVGLCLCLALAASACTADPSTPSDHMKIYETCLETACDQLQESGNSACNACNSACFAASYDCDPSTACEESCSPRECDDGQRDECVEQGFKVVLADNPDPSVEKACEATLAHITSCGYSSQATASDCRRYASTEAPDTALAAYQCMAAADCSNLTDSLAACDPTPGTFGDEICDALGSACPPEQACSSPFQAELDADGAWLRSDALDAARGCLSQPSCQETRDCLSQWTSAVE